MLANSALNTLSSFLPYLNWVCDFLLHLSFFHHQPMFPKNSQLERLGDRVRRFGDEWEDTEEVECAICLSMIEEDEEIELVRCKHVFHKKCLERWVEHRQTTCPLCRDYVAGPRLVCEVGRELIVFCFGGDGGSGHDDYGKWWLR